jgi:hypothetical protein
LKRAPQTFVGLRKRLWRPQKSLTKTSTAKSEREERADKTLKDRERARKWHKDNIDHKNNADLNTKLIAKHSEKIIFLEAELCKAHEHEIMAERNASNEMYGGINQKSQSTSYAAPTASSLAKGGPSPQLCDF